MANDMTTMTMMPPLAIATYLSVLVVVISIASDVIIGVHSFQVAVRAPAAAAVSINTRSSSSSSSSMTTATTSTCCRSSSLFAISIPISPSSSTNNDDINNSNSSNNNDYVSMTTLPRHPTNHDANEILSRAEKALQLMHEEVLASYATSSSSLDGMGDDDILSQSDATDIIIDNSADSDDDFDEDDEDCILSNLLTNNIESSVYANSYVDLGKVDTVGFDFDYTLVTYTTELLSLIYDMSLKRLVEEKEYPREMLSAGLKFDPFFSIRGE